MAAPTVSSTSTNNNFGVAANLSLAAPSGIQDGDILLLLAGGNASTITCSGFTQISTSVISTSTCMTRAFYKVASSESGSYTVANNSADGIAAAMLRLTGDAEAVFNFDTETDESSTDTVVKQSPSLLVMFGKANSNISHSGYTITHGSSNPTWTELYDVSDTTPDQAFFVAYATTTDTSNVTAWSYTESTTATNTAQLVVCLSTQSVTGTFTHLSPNPSFHTPTTTTGVTGTFTHLSPSPNLNAPTTTVTNQIWTPINKT